MLGSFRIGSKLIGGFSVVIAILIALVSYSYLSLLFIKGQQERSSAIGEAALNADHMRRVPYKMYCVIADATINRDLNESQKKWEAIKKEQKSVCSDAVKMAISDQERQLINDASKDFDSLVRCYENEMLPLLTKERNEQNDLALKNIDAQIDKLIDSCNVPVMKLGEFYKQEDARVVKLLNEKIQSIMNVSLLASIVAVLVSSTVSISLTRSITRPLNKVVVLLKELAKGHLGKRLNLQRADEIGVLAQTMDDFADDLQNNVVSNIKKMAVGDLSITVLKKDDEDEVAPAINLMIDTMRDLMSELSNLNSSAQDGKLSVRGSVSRFSGAYRGIVEGFNSCLDALINPLNVAAQYIDQMAKGNMPPKIVDEYKGDFNLIKNNLNTCIDAIQALIKEADVVANAAISGRIQTRADVLRHHGDYRKIIVGFNSTLDSIVGLIENAPIPSMIVDKNFTVLFMNKEAAKAGDKLPSDVIGQHCYNHFRTGDCNSDECAVQRSFKSGGVAQSQTDAHPGKNHLDISYISSPVRDLSGEIVAASEWVIDLTEVKQAQRIAKKQAEYQAREIAKLGSCLTSLAQGDLTFSVQVAEADADTLSIKDNFSKIYNALEEARLRLHDTLSKVSESVAQVKSGAIQISDNSQSLSQGATEQAASLEEITSSMTQVASQTKTNAENAAQSNQISKQAQEATNKGGEQIRGMVLAMHEINQAGQQIAKIIKAIDDIAFQTNLLALNAAVEAARAGRHGKGFAVVADEVRSLAGRSAHAAKETADLIAASTKKVENGLDAANRTSDSFKQIEQEIVKVADLVAEIAAASNEQAQGVAQINQGLAQVDAVTQQNTANAEEMAASAEELSGQSAQLYDLVAKFNLSKERQKSKKDQMLLT